MTLRNTSGLNDRSIVTHRITRTFCAQCSHLRNSRARISRLRRLFGTYGRAARSPAFCSPNRQRARMGRIPWLPSQPPPLPGVEVPVHHALIVRVDNEPVEPFGRPVSRRGVRMSARVPVTSSALGWWTCGRCAQRARGRTSAPRRGAVLSRRPRCGAPGAVRRQPDGTRRRRRRHG